MAHTSSRPGPHRIRGIAAAALVAVLALLSACADGPTVQDGLTRDFSAPTEEFRGAQEDSPAFSPDDPESMQREVIQTARMLVRVRNALESAAEAARITEEVNGRVDDRTERPETEESMGWATLTIRVPADELDGVINQFRELGTVEELTVSARDVTTEVIDVDARIRSLSGSIERLQQIISDATSAEDLIAGENALAERQAELESLQARRDYLTDQVALSTIYLSLEQRPADPNPAEGFWGGVQQGWQALITAVRSAIVGLGLSLPWVGFFAIGAAVIYIVVRLISRRR